MAKKDIHFEIKIDPETMVYFQRAPKALKEAEMKAVEAMGMVWADEAKDITTNEGHIDTGLYVNSIGYSTGSPSKPIHTIEASASETQLITGADVQYAVALEKRYSIMARALDMAQDRMAKVAENQVKNQLNL